MSKVYKVVVMWQTRDKAGHLNGSWEWRMDPGCWEDEGEAKQYAADRLCEEGVHSTAVIVIDTVVKVRCSHIYCDRPATSVWDLPCSYEYAEKIEKFAASCDLTAATPALPY